MEFTSHEKSAMVGILTAIVYADGFINEKEVDYLGRIGYDLDITDENIINAGLEMDLTEAFSVISALAGKKKEVARETLLRTAYIDKDHLDASEQELIAEIFLHCGMAADL